MTSSATYTWQLNVADIMEDAYELAGYQMNSAYDAETARRSLNILLSEWLNHGVNLWTMEYLSTDLVDGTASYTFNSRIQGIVSNVLRDSTTDYPLEQISIEEYNEIPNKTNSGTPTQYAVLRTDPMVVYLYPTPDDSTLDMKTWAIRRVQDISTSAETADVPHRFVPALILGLAYKLALKKPSNTNLDTAQADINRIDRLKQDYMDAFDLARGMDKDNASMFIRPLTVRR